MAPYPKKRGSNLYVEFKQVVNLTGREIIMYDSEGDIVHIKKNTRKNLTHELCDDLMFIVNSVADGLAFGLDPAHTVMPFSEHFGRKGRKLCKLHRPSDNAIVEFSPPCSGQADEFSI